MRVCVCSLRWRDERCHGAFYCVSEEILIGGPEVENPYWSFEGKRYTLRIALEASFVPLASRVRLRFGLRPASRRRGD